jgi:hypothetical protein
VLTPAIADRVAESTTSTGTGTVNLDGAQTRFRSFATAGLTGREVEYTIAHRTLGEWEVGVGVFTTGTPGTLTRTRVKSSSAGGSLVTFSAGTKDVFIAMPSQRGSTASQVFLASSL